MDLRTWQGRLWFGLTIALSTSFVMLIGPAYLQPLPTWLKVLVGVACGFIVATLAVYSRRRARRANSL